MENEICKVAEIVAGVFENVLPIPARKNKKRDETLEWLRHKILKVNTLRKYLKMKIILD